MKRLLLGPAFALPLILGLCSFHKPEVPKVPEVVRQIPLDDFEHFDLKRVPAKEFEKANPTPPVHHQVKPNGNHSRRRIAPAAPVLAPRNTVRRNVPVARPQADQAPVEALPPQQGPICIFPLNMVPNCTPEPAGRMP